MKLFYKIPVNDYREKLDEVRERFMMHEEEDEARINLKMDDESQIERVICTVNPNQDELAHIRVILNDNSLQQYFDSVFGTPYKIKE